MVDVAPQIGVRQTRLLEGEYVVTKDDVTTAGTSPTPWRAAATTTRRTGRCCREDVDELLVAGRHYSGDPGGAEDVARDPALHGHGPGRRRRRRRSPSQGTAVRDVPPLEIQQGCAAQGADPGDVPSANATLDLDAGWRYERRDRDCCTHDGGPPPPDRDTLNAPAPRCRSPGSGCVDFTQVMMGPACTQMLADYGADVIKVERPGAGDLSRTSFPDPDGLDNPVFLSLNRNKRSICGGHPHRRGQGRAPPPARPTPTWSSTTSAPA